MFSLIYLPAYCVSDVIISPVLWVKCNYFNFALCYVRLYHLCAVSGASTSHAHCVRWLLHHLCLLSFDIYHFTCTQCVRCDVLTCILWQVWYCHLYCLLKHPRRASCSSLMQPRSRSWAVLSHPRVSACPPLSMEPMCRPDHSHADQNIAIQTRI